MLLLDEPLSALDAKLREQMQIEMKHLHEKVGITFVMVTHDQTEALVMSDRVVVMEKGRIAQMGKPQELYDHPVSPYVANFIGTTNFLPGKLEEATPGAFAISAGGTRLIAASDAAIPAGSKVTAGFRPEKARFLAEGESAANVLSGTISEVIYYGLGLRIGVALPEGSTVYADTLLPDRLSNSVLPEVGAPARLAVEPHNVFVFEGIVAP